jgi:glycosyltransferase involved in cell wall biosynthesis
MDSHNRPSAHAGQSEGMAAVNHVARPHICFVAPAAWPVLAGRADIPVVGGAEVQQSILARGLAAAGYPTSMICWDFGQPDRCIVDGVTVYKTCTPSAGIPVLRFIHPRLTSMWRELHRVNADIYYQRSAAMLTGVVAEFCKRSGKKSIYAGASNVDFVPRKLPIQYSRDRHIYHYGIRSVDAIVVQNENQARDCSRNYGRSSTLIPSCHPLLQVPDFDREAGYVLWVGTIREYKRPELLLGIARRLPCFRFKIIGGPGGDDSASLAYFEIIKNQSKDIPNIEFLGFVPFSDIGQHFDGARVFVNTSRFEGFPNTFLQAWARGIPTVSFFDTGSLLNSSPVSTIVGTEIEAVQKLDRLMTNADEWRRASVDCREYFERNHSVKHAIELYEQLFENLHYADTQTKSAFAG